MDLVYKFSHTPSSKKTTVLPAWKRDLALLPAITTWQAACAFADIDPWEIDLLMGNAEREAKQVEISRWCRAIERAAGTSELPATLIKNLDEYDLWIFSPSDFSDWCTSRGIICPIPAPNSSTKLETMPSSRMDDIQVPGKPPPNYVGEAAVKIAWRLEQENGLLASAKDVMAELRKDAKNGGEDGRLKLPEEGKPGVMWHTSKAEWKPWSIEACSLALKKWNISRKEAAC